MIEDGTPRRVMPPLVKLATEIGPLIVFFFANARFDLFAATGAFMAAIMIALIVSYALTRHLPIMALISAAIVLVFGGLTLVLHDETFIKMKPTIIYLLFGGTLAAGLLLKRPFLRVVFDQVFSLTAEGWRLLTWRWMGFFLVMAVLNEIVWRTQGTDFWVAFKAFGVLPLTFIFGALQYPLLVKHEAPSADAESKST